MAPRLTLLLLVAVFVAACRDDAAARPNAATTSASVAAVVTTSSATVSASVTVQAIVKPTEEQRAGWKQCAERRQKALADKALPGAPSFEKNRVQMSRVRGRPMLWKRVPGKLSFLLERQLKRSKSALKAVQVVFRKAKYSVLRRRDFLREGYLWADDAELGVAMVEQLSLVSLFRHHKLHLQRGLSVYTLERRKKTRFLPEQFVHVDGDLAGKAAELLLGDRVAIKRNELTK